MRDLIIAGLAIVVMLAVSQALIRLTAEELVKADARLEAERWAASLRSAVPALNGSAEDPEVLAVLDQAASFGQKLTLHVKTADGIQRFTPTGLVPVIDTVPDITTAALTWRTQAGSPTVQSQVKSPLRTGTGIAMWLVVESDQTARYAAAFNALLKVSAGVALALSILAGLGLLQSNRLRRQARQALEMTAQRDPLTGLPNKQALLKTIEQKLHNATGARKPGAVILCEAALPAGILQSLGEESEDALIAESANRLVAQARGRYDMARIGRLAFGLSVNHTADAMEILALAKDITVKLSEPVEWRGQSLSVAAHAGIALTTSDGESPEALLRNAELALHAAQEQGTPGYGFFNPEIARDMRRQADVQRAVSAAAASQSFRLDYQPVYNIRTGELTGFEALIRMQDQELGAVSPAEFIPVAEQMGLINSIGAWCLLEACRTAAEWPPHLQVAVNLSPFQFHSGSLVSDVRRALEQARLPAYRLEVEITEGTLLNASEMVLTQLRSLRDMGVAVALDDFGTGYSSLGYLWKFPFSKLKIDRSFVQALEESPSAKGILRSIVKLGHGLGLTVTAEGIETQKQFGVLRDLGCDLAQGFLLDRPARAADLAAIILRNFANGLHRRSRDAAIPDRTAA